MLTAIEVVNLNNVDMQINRERELSKSSAKNGAVIEAIKTLTRRKAAEATGISLNGIRRIAWMLADKAF